MSDTPAGQHVRDTPDRVLHAYLLGRTGCDDVLALQRRFVYDVAGAPESGCVIVCEPEPGITIGREGSRVHVRPGPEALHAREWPVRWEARGGGAMLHLPGQVVCYPVVSLAALQMTPAGYVRELGLLVADLLGEYDIRGEVDDARPGVWVGGRRVAHVGVAVRDGVTGFGLVLNVAPDLEPFRDVRCDGDPRPMTSVQRETTARVRVPAVRQQLVERVARRFRFDRVAVFHHHPALSPHPRRHAAPTGTR